MSITMSKPRMRTTDNPTNEEIIKLAQINDVKFVRLQFIDIYGIVKNLAVPVEQLPKALDNEVMLDGSSIKGFQRIERSDLYFYPDKKTFRILPWRPQEGRVARMVCDIYDPDGKPFPGCPRNNLKRVLAQVEKELGYTMNVGPECEFFLFNKDQSGNPTIDPSDVAAYFDVEPLDIGQQVSKEMKWYIGGLLKHIRGICAITNPLVNSYKRLVPGY